MHHKIFACYIFASTTMAAFNHVGDGILNILAIADQGGANLRLEKRDNILRQFFLRKGMIAALLYHISLWS